MDGSLKWVRRSPALTKGLCVPGLAVGRREMRDVAFGKVRPRPQDGRDGDFPTQLGPGRKGRVVLGARAIDGGETAVVAFVSVASLGFPPRG